MVATVLVITCWTLLMAYWNIAARSVKPPEERQTSAARLARIPVWLGFLLFLAAWIFPFGAVAVHRTHLSDSVGVAICAFGLLFAIWSRRTLGAEWSRDVELKRGHALVRSGPYRLVRHPIYTAHLLMGLGTAIASGLLIAFAGFASLALGFWIKLRQEEELLLRSFPNEYPVYKRHVKGLVPYLF